MMTGYHARLGFYFERLQDGSVRLKREHPPGSGQIALSITITAEEWASVVASMSLRGETGETHAEALERHMRPTP